MTWSVVRAGRRLAALGVVFALVLLAASPAAAQTSGSKPPATGGTGTTNPPTTGGGTGTTNPPTTGGGTGTTNPPTTGGGSGSSGAATDLTTAIEPFIALTAEIADSLNLTFDSDQAVLRFFRIVFLFFSWLEEFNSPAPPASGGSGSGGSSG